MTSYEQTQNQREEKPKTETVTEWANEHPEFQLRWWWRGHRDGGFVEDPNTGRDILEH